MSKNWKNKKTDALFDAVLKLKNRRECENFFRDLCSLNEIKSLAERWQVAQLVNEKVSYRDIAEQTGVSTATVTRIAQWVHHGEGGYRLMLSRR